MDAAIKSQEERETRRGGVMSYSQKFTSHALNTELRSSVKTMNLETRNHNDPTNNLRRSKTSQSAT